MSKIKILPESWANQIAAGEVVERPASVVREFVENSIDAKAENIIIEVQGNGAGLIRVIDDGLGMDGDDALLCLERHATSKLAGPEDLARIKSLGFRGEAVPSIASISRLTIITRQQESQLGTRVELRFGQVRKVHETGCAGGTIIEVRDLFGNVPARRKFLKSARTELFHIEEVVKNYALAWAGKGFVYSVNGREVWRFPAGQALEQRLRRIFRRREGSLIAVDSGLVGAGAKGRVNGFLLPPDEAGGAAARLRLFVNGRAVRDRMVSHAVSEGMRNFLLKGRSPAGALFFEVDPELVDVNVHPAKQEIRFQRANDIHQLVAAAVGRALEDFQQQARAELFAVPDSVPSPSTDRAKTGETAAISQAGLPENKPYPQSPDVAGFAGGEAVSPESAEPGPPVLFCPDPEKSNPEPPALSPAQAVGSPHSFARLRYIGQIFSSYLLCQSDSGLVVIDQHAAHERLLFEKLKKRYQRGRPARQTLLFPEIVECAPHELRIVKKYGREIAALGFDIQEFGGNSCAVKALPAIIAHLRPAEAMSGIIEGFAQGRAVKAAARIEDILAGMACKAAIKANHDLEPEEAEALLEQMLKADIFSHCPHGRPVAKLFSPAEVSKWFHRT